MTVLGTLENGDTKFDHVQTDAMNGLVVVSPQSRWLALACADGRVRLWDLNTKEISKSTRQLERPGGQVISMVFSSDERWLITGARKSACALQAWDLHSSDDLPASR